MPTLRDSYDVLLGAVREPATKANRRFGCKDSVGIGILGVPETEDDTLYVASVPATSGKPLRTDLNVRLDRDVRPGSDTSYLALSETWGDEFTQYPLVMGLILGTGVGGELIFNGKPTTGKGYITGEFSRIRLPVDASTMMGSDFPLRRYDCGQYSCIENCLSDHGFAQLYQYYHHQPLQASEIIALYDQDDGQARTYVERYLDLLAVCLGNIPTIASPDLAVIGDGLSNFSVTTTQLAERLPRRFLSVACVPYVERTRHSDVGGMHGAVFLYLTN